MLKKFDCKLQEVKKVNLVDSNFIPQKIEEYIRENIKYKYVCSYNYKNNIINIEYYCSKKKKNTDLFKIIVKRIIFMMIISNTYKNLNIEIYDTPFKKEFHCNNHKKCGNLSHNNVNSGLSYLNNIVIFRREEMLKLLIHELIHALDIDNKYETIQDKKKNIRII